MPYLTSNPSMVIETIALVSAYLRVSLILDVRHFYSYAAATASSRLRASPSLMADDELSEPRTGANRYQLISRQKEDSL